MLVETIEQMDTIEPIITAMIVAWFSGDDREFARLFDLQTGDSPEIQAFVRRLLEDRNVGMAEKIAGYSECAGNDIRSRRRRAFDRTRGYRGSARSARPAGSPHQLKRLDLEDPSWI